MSEVIEPVAYDAVIQKVCPVPLAGFVHPVLRDAPTMRPAGGKHQRWSTALSEQDLKCLLQVIECDLIPQLLNSYSPARHSPSGLPMAVG